MLLLQCSVFLPSFYGPRKTVLKETCPHVMLLAFLTSQLLKPIFDWIFFWGKTTFCLMDLSVSLPSRHYLLMWKCFQNCGIDWDKKAKPTWTLLCSQGSQRRGAVHMFLSLLSTSWCLKKVKVKVKKVVTFECGCDDNWGIGIPFSQHWMPSTWCHKPLSQLWV